MIPHRWSSLHKTDRHEDRAPEPWCTQCVDPQLMDWSRIVLADFQLAYVTERAAQYAEQTEDHVT